VTKILNLLASPVRILLAIQSQRERDAAKIAAQFACRREVRQRNMMGKG